MILKLPALFCVCLALAAAGCAAPRPVAAPPSGAPASVQDVLPAPSPPQAKAAAARRPRMLGLDLAVEVRRPAVPPAALERALFSARPDAALRSAALAHLAGLHLDAGRPDAAGAAARGAYALALDAYGPDHVTTLSALGALGEALSLQGQDGRAESLLLLAHRRTRDLLGEAHPLSVAASGRLAAHRAGTAPGLRLLRNLNRRIGQIG